MEEAASRASITQRKRCLGFLNKNMTFSFAAGFCMTLMVHGFAFMNHVLNNDQVQNVFALPATYNLGRWFLDFVLETGSRLSMPWLNGLILALTMGAAVALITDLLRIKRRIPVFLIAWAMVAFPSFTMAVTYIHVVYAYGVAVLLAAFSVWLCDRWKWGIVPAAACLTLSLGIYQAYWSFAVSLMCVRGLQVLLKGEAKNREIVFIAIRYVLVLIIGLLCYLLLNRYALSARQIELSDYMGVNRMGSLPVKLLPHLMKTSYLQFFTLLFANARLDGGLLGVVVQAAIFVFLLGAIVWMTLKRKRTVFQYLCIAGITLMLPLFFNTVYFMNSSSVHGIMVYSVVGVYILAGWLLEEGLSVSAGPGRVVRIASVALACMMAVSSFHSTIYANQLYYLNTLEFNAMSEYMSRVLYRLESNENYSQETPVLFVGAVSASGYASVPFLDNMPRFEGGRPFWVLRTNGHIRSFLFSYLHVTTPMPDAATTEALLNDEAVQNMPCYPSLDCIRLIDGVLVVKVGN